MMRKHVWITGLALAGLVFTLAWPAMAQGWNQGENQRGPGFRMREGNMDPDERPAGPRQGLRRLDGQGPRKVDTVGDDVCDNLEDNLAAGPPPRARRFAGQGPGFIDDDGDGVCDHRPPRQPRGARRLDGQGPRKVDTDGDGVCDNLEDNLAAGPPPRAHRFAGQGPGFIDEDGDGICDQRPAGPPPQGRGYGRGPGYGPPPEGRGYGRGQGFRPQGGPEFRER